MLQKYSHKTGLWIRFYLCRNNTFCHLCKLIIYYAKPISSAGDVEYEEVGWGSPIEKWDLRTILDSQIKNNLDGWGQYSSHLAVESCITIILKRMNGSFSKLPKYGTMSLTMSTVVFNEEHMPPGFLVAQDPRKFLASFLSHVERPVERMYSFPLLRFSLLFLFSRLREVGREESLYNIF